MCKIMVLKGVQDSGLALKFMTAVAPTMSQGNNDGIGYSAINSKNELFMEKWHRNSQFLQLDTVIDETTVKALEQFKSRIGTPPLNYTSYGNISRDDMTTITMHTRYATCGKEFANTHPFIDNEMSLIHNGGIYNSVELKLNKISICDSEVALQLYNNEQINLSTSPEVVQNFMDQLKGYWAFAFLAKDADGTYMLDIVRERATVYWAELTELGKDCVVFATTQEIINIGVEALGLPKRTEISLLPESNYYRYNALTGLDIIDFELAESKLNRVIKYPAYNKHQYNDKPEYVTMITSSHKYNELQTKLNRDAEIEEIYEGYSKDKKHAYKSKKFKEEIQGVSDDLVVEGY